MDCPYCYRVGEPSQMGNIDFSSAQRYIDCLVLHGCKTISLTGGEPLLNPFWRDILEYCYDQGLYTILSTNGLLLDIHDPVLQKLCVLALSLDGSTAEVNAKTRTREQYQKVTSLINETVLQRPRYLLKINTVLSKYNYQDLSGILHLLDYDSVIWKIFKIRKKGNYYSFPEEMILSNDEFEEAKKTLLQKRTKCAIYFMGGDVAGDEKVVNPDYFILDYNGDLYLGDENENKFLFNIERDDAYDVSVDYEKINNQYQENFKNVNKRL